MITRVLLAGLVAGLFLVSPVHADAAADWNALLGKAVKTDGVDYSVIRKDRKTLDAYVKALEKAKAGKTREEQIAFWINAYNALTVQQVLDTRKPGDKDYSVYRSVKDFWKKRTWPVAGQKLTLDGIEKGILLKKYKDARVHFAVNCASWSCPALRDRLWKASTLDHDLTQATRIYLGDKRHNTFDIARREAALSKLFDWYRKDFERGMPEKSVKLQAFLAKYAPSDKLRRALTKGTAWRFKFNDYDWSINDAGSKGRSSQTPISWIWLVLYIIATGGLLAYGFHAYKMLRWRKKHGPKYDAVLARARAESDLARTVFPRVLVQLPIYNEAAVAEGAIDAVAATDWPHDRLEIQVLDDSNDETCAIVDAAVARHAEAGVPIAVLRRPHRDGFKAGALAAGLNVSSAEFVALFDADFLPTPDFVRRALPLFDADTKVGCVQGRWGHLNRSQNWLTRAQAVAVDAHFHVQQYARAAAGKFLNFNGTAGMWRVRTIAEVGGWVGDTLTEDLDLSYRAQLEGWRIVFDPELVVRAELPPTLDAYKNQQRRWACGSIQCARKFLGPVWRSKLSLTTKLESTFHLCGYGVCVAMVLLIAVLPFGVSHWSLFSRHPELWPVWVAIWISAIGPLTMTAYAQLQRGRIRVRDLVGCFMLGLGSCMTNAIAVFRGLFRPIRTFVRTPKQGMQRVRLRTPVPVTEQVMTVFSLACVGYLATTNPWATATYALFCCSGFCTLAGYWWLAERK